MKDEEIEQLLLDNDLTDTVYLTGYNYYSAIIGYTDDGGLVYSYEKMIEYLIKEAEMTQEEAIEWIDYNVLRAIPYMGDTKPIIVYELIQ